MDIVNFDSVFIITQTQLAKFRKTLKYNLLQVTLFEFLFYQVNKSNNNLQSNTFSSLGPETSMRQVMIRTVRIKWDSTSNLLALWHHIVCCILILCSAMKLNQLTVPSASLTVIERQLYGNILFW